MRIAVAALNFPDVLVVANEYQVQAPTPFIPGSEYAGVVTEVADDVTGIDVGDRVFGSVFIGAFAEEIVVGTSSLARIPDEVDDRTAAAFGVTYKTAYHVLRSVATLAEGEELIVLGAGGGVGSAAVQLGVAMGATVTAVASSAEKLAAAESCGPPGSSTTGRATSARRSVRYCPREPTSCRPGGGRPGRTGPARRCASTVVS